MFEGVTLSSFNSVGLSLSMVSGIHVYIHTNTRLVNNESCRLHRTTCKQWLLKAAYQTSLWKPGKGEQNPLNTTACDQDLTGKRLRQLDMASKNSL